MTNHAKINRLIPWYVNGTLGEAERLEVKAHLTDCLTCRQAEREARHLQAAVNQQATIPLGSDSGLDALYKRIDASSEQQPRRWQFSAASLRIAAAAAIGLVIAVAAIVSFEPRNDADFTTLASPAEEGQRIDLIFAGDLDAEDALKIIDSVGGRIVAGPSGIGRYTVELEGRADIERALQRLQQDPRIEFAGPSFIGEATE
jgi:hypothetical protein